jgi:hypothetical protein
VLTRDLRAALGRLNPDLLDEVFTNLPTSPFTPEEKNLAAQNVYTGVWQQAMGGFWAVS